MAKKILPEQLKIAMIGQKRIPSREGGVEIVVEELSTRMAALGHDVTCFNRKGHHVAGKEFDQAAAADTYKGVKIKPVATIDCKGLAAVTSSFIAALKAALGPYDIVHFHAEGPCAMLWLPKLFSKRCIATIHGLDWQREKWKTGFGRVYIKLGEKVAAKYADEIIVLSEGVRRYFYSTYHRETHFIPNGVSRPTIREAKKITEKFGLHKEEYILFLGRIVPEKGLVCLIQAYKQIKTNKKLVIAGGASDTDGFMKRLQLLAADDNRILFTGFVQGQMLEELYSNAYLYVLPSDLEGMPLSLLEAMSYGNCCLVSDIPECADVVEDRAVVFRHGDVMDLQDKLQALCDKTDMVMHYASETTEFICLKYSWDHMALETAAVYEGNPSTEDLNPEQQTDVRMPVMQTARKYPFF